MININTIKQGTIVKVGSSLEITSQNFGLAIEMKEMKNKLYKVKDIVLETGDYISSVSVCYNDYMTFSFDPRDLYYPIETESIKPEKFDCEDLMLP